MWSLHQKGKATEDYFGFTISQMPGGDKVIESAAKLGVERRAEAQAPAQLTEAMAKADKAVADATTAQATATGAGAAGAGAGAAGAGAAAGLGAAAGAAAGGGGPHRPFTVATLNPPPGTPAAVGVVAAGEAAPGVDGGVAGTGPSDAL